MVRTGVPRIPQADHGHRQRTGCWCDRPRQRQPHGRRGAPPGRSVRRGSEAPRSGPREYRGPVNTVLALQRSATDGIVAALDVDLTRSERAVLLQRSHDKCGGVRPLPAREGSSDRPRQCQYATNLSQPRLEGLQRAQSYYARARESDPGFAAPRASPRHVASRARRSMTGPARVVTRRDSRRRPRSVLNPGYPKRTRHSPRTGCSASEPVNAIGELERALAGRPNASHLYRLLGANLRRAWAAGRRR